MRLARAIAFLIIASPVFLACAKAKPEDGSLHRWWQALGPVIPHDDFPADCSMCHVGSNWDQLKASFKFDHKKETGYELKGSHKQALCLRCHNDRGPVQSFLAKGCAGCHEDYHYGQLGQNCTKCHNEVTWRPVNQIALHNRTRFPLTGSHVLVACQRCHIGARVGVFQPIDVQCLTCHQVDLANANNPPHLNLGYVNQCHRCHIPTTWNQATIDPNFPNQRAAQKRK